MNSSCTTVITDFGSARFLRDDQPAERSFKVDAEADEKAAVEIAINASDANLTLTGPNVSYRWASPEVLDGEDPRLPSDVWALGWICWEV